MQSCLFKPAQEFGLALQRRADEWQAQEAREEVGPRQLYRIIALYTTLLKGIATRSKDAIGGSWHRY